MFASIKKILPSSKKQPTRPGFKPQLELLEERTLMSATPLVWTAPSKNTANAIVLTEVTSGVGTSAQKIIEISDNGVLVASRAVSVTSSITITGSATAVNSFQILMTPKGIPTTVNFKTASDAASVGDAKGVQDILGPVTVNGAGVSLTAHNALTVNDSADRGTRTAAITGTSITGLAPAAISFTKMNYLTVDGSAGSSNTYTISGAVTFYDESVTDTLQIKAGTGSEYVHGRIGDVAYLHGAQTGTNVFTANPDAASLTGAGYSESVSNIQTIVATSYSATDVANMYDLGPATVNTFVAQPTTSSMTGSNYDNMAVNFQHVYANGSSTLDTANFNGGSPLNTFVANTTSSYMYGANYFAQASGFTTVNSTSQTGKDTADFYGSGYFTATPHQAQLTTGNTTIRVTNYGSVYEYLTSSAFELTSAGTLYENMPVLNQAALVNVSGTVGGTVSNNYWAQVDTGVNTLAIGQLVSANYVWDLSGAGSVAHQFGGTSSAGSSAVFVLNCLGDLNVRQVVFQDTVRDGVLGYSQMLDVYTAIENEGAMNNNSFADLKTLVSIGSGLGMPAAVQDLAGKVVNGDDGNNLYQFVNSVGQVQTTPLGNLTAGSSAKQLTQLVNKWFLGMNDPLVDSGVQYRPADLSIPLVSGGFNYYDVNQNNEGDCWLMSSLAEIAVQRPSVLQSMFTYEGVTYVDGNQVLVYAVRLYKDGAPYYVTVNTDLPNGGRGYYANVSHDNPDLSTSQELWVALAEKAYAQANGSGAVISSDNYTDSYAALNGGWPTWALYGLTGTNADHIGVSTSTLGADWDRGQFVVLCTTDPSDSQIVGNHCYAVVGYNPSSSAPFELFNPWGLKGSVKTYTQYDLFWAPASVVAENFNSEVLAGSEMHREAAISAENAVLATDLESSGERRPVANDRVIVEVGSTDEAPHSGWELFFEDGLRRQL